MSLVIVFQTIAIALFGTVLFAVLWMICSANANNSTDANLISEIRWKVPYLFF